VLSAALWMCECSGSVVVLVATLAGVWWFVDWS
jgi:hypothetical protein